MNDDLAGIQCARCGRLAPITVDELTGGGREDGREVMPTIAVAPDDWRELDDELVCSACATRREHIESECGLASVEKTAQTLRELDSQHARLADAVEAQAITEQEAELLLTAGLNEAVKRCMAHADQLDEIVDDLDDEDDPRDDIHAY